VRPGRPAGGARLDLVETLRAAAPWQPLRRREVGEGAAARVLVRREDFRLRRFKRPTETLTLFVVDASGSAAAQRLAEAKGAVELLLAESYVRRDRVALITFRGAGAELALPPTRALARAKRALAGLPGGGGTPLVCGLEMAADEAEAAARRGWTPSLILLTDGRANVDRDGRGGRARAAEQATQAARRIAALRLGAALIDASPRPNPAARDLAQAMGATYLPLPRADAGALAALGRR
jgi:magnesium chelatase subunit D